VILFLKPFRFEQTHSTFCHRVFYGLTSWGSVHPLTFAVGFLLGAMFGACLGALIIGALHAAKRADAKLILLHKLKD
jgi:hypothetical protein